jgi:thiol-disulfide isomerase/thioredoxin
LPRLRPGDRAPDVTLPAADREGVVSLMDYREKQSVLLALYRNLYCPFCRWQMSQLALSAESLEKAGVATLAVVATTPERALVLSVPSPELCVAADPGLNTHRAYGLRRVPKTPAVMQIIEGAAAEMARELGIPTIPGQAHDAILRFDGFEPVESDRQDLERDQEQALVIGQFLIDRQGIVRWMHLERTPGERLNEEELLAAL